MYVFVNAIGGAGGLGRYSIERLSIRLVEGGDKRTMPQIRRTIVFRFRAGASPLGPVLVEVDFGDSHSRKGGEEARVESIQKPSIFSVLLLRIIADVVCCGDYFLPPLHVWV